MVICSLVTRKWPYFNLKKQVTSIVPNLMLINDDQLNSLFDLNKSIYKVPVNNEVSFLLFNLD